MSGESPSFRKCSSRISIGIDDDHLAEASHFEKFQLPDLEHQRAEFFTDETHLALAQIDRVEMVRGQGFSDRISS